MPSSSALYKMVSNAGINPEWLLTGNGEIFKIPVVENPPKKDLHEFASRLRGLMDDRGMSPADLSLVIGVKRQVVSNWLRAKNYPSDLAVKKLAALFSVNKYWLITGSEIEPREIVFLEPAREMRRAPEKSPASEDGVLLEKLVDDLGKNNLIRREVLRYYKSLKSETSTPRIFNTSGDNAEKNVMLKKGKRRKKN